MKIYKDEARIDGLADKILANTSVAYSSEIQPWLPSKVESSQKRQLSKAFEVAAEMHGRSVGSAFDSDLYFTKSILVTTNWNRNDDVFAPEPVWLARHTPSHKPTNIEHDETRLVGHITETWAIDGDGNYIPDNTVVGDLPELFHLANGAVIYKNWEDEELVARTSELIGEIEAGKKFVSMEALFSNFDYAIVTPEKQYHVVARSQDTAFLTKHLRIYGGTGEFDGCSVGRLLRNITFCGKGYVDKPANPHSVIFNEAQSFNYSAASSENPFQRESGVLISYSNSISSDNKVENKSMQNADNLSVDLLTKQNEKNETTIASLQAKVDELTKASSEAGVKTLETQVSELSSKLEAAEKARDEAVASVENLTSEKEELSSQLTEANEAKSALQQEVDEAKAAKVIADRVAHLVDGGVEKEVAELKVETFASLNDEQFNSVAEDIIAAVEAGKMYDGKKEDKEDKEDKDAEASETEEVVAEDITEDPAEASADEAVIEDADASEVEEEPVLSAEASDDNTETESLREELRSALASRLGYEVEVKEEEASE